MEKHDERGALGYQNGWCRRRLLYHSIILFFTSNYIFFRSKIVLDIFLFTIFHNKPVKRQPNCNGHPFYLTLPKDYGISGFLPKGTLQLFRFLLAFTVPVTIICFLFSGFSFEKYQWSLRAQ